MNNRLIYLIAFIISCGIMANAHNRHVRHLTIEDGLSSNAVYSITQDDLGRMWFGTIDGLHCFDGKNISIWRDSHTSSLGQVIYSIREDNKNRLWIGSDMGLALFDLKKERFSRSPVETDETRIVSPVSDILFDNKGRTWISTSGQGIFRYDENTGNTIHYAAIGKINSDIISHIMEDSSGTLWATSQEEGLSRFDEKDNIFVPVPDSPKNTISVFEDMSGNIWTGTEKGLFRFDRHSGEWSHILHPENNGVFQIRSIVELKRGILLLASDEGLTKFDTSTNECHTFKAYPEIPGNLNDSYLHSLFLDRENNLWIGTYFGGVNYIPQTFRLFSHYNNNNSKCNARIISVFAKGKDNNVWIGTDDAGFFKWNRKENSFTSFGTHDEKGLTYHNIHALLQDGEKLFIGMYMGGLDILDIPTSEFRNYKGGKQTNSLYSSSIYAIFKDSRNSIWIGTTKGLNRYRKDTDDFERIFDLNHADVEYIFEDRCGYLYACSLNQGVFRLDPHNGKWKQFTTVNNKNKTDAGLPSYKILTGAEDNKGRLWFGTDGCGLFRFMPDEERFVKAPLPEYIRVVNKIIPAENDLWITTSNGLYCYNPESGGIQSFYRSSGLQGNLFLPNSGIKLDDGTILVGGINGFNEFNPVDFNFRPHNPKVILTDLTLFNRHAPIDTVNSPLSSSLAYSDKLQLSHEHSIFGFSVAVPSYSNPALNKFQYKLDGFDPDWIEGPSDGHVNYTNLPSGKYTFLVRAADGTGGWNENSLSFPIEVLPPWWLSIPMMITYAMVFILCLVFFYLKLKNKQKKELQMLSIRKDKELYHSKIEFFTHMVHEIRTPLTLILTPLESVMKSDRRISDELPTLNVIANNGKRLLNLVNKLMDFRKIESGNVKIDLRPADMKEIMSETLNNFRPMAKNKNISVMLEVPDNECLAMADKEALRHVLDNLLSNALKFTRDRIIIELTESDETFCINVEDNGIGIDKNEQKKIFDPFYQIAETRPHDNIGTGIGLLLVKKYIDLMGGRLQVDSTPDNGAAFRFWLRKAEKHNADIPSACICPNVNQFAENNTCEVNKDRILIVEDNLELLDFLRNLFSPDYEVSCASNGKHALRFLAENPCDIIISDVMMPEINGIELCRKVKTDIATSHIPVILLTAKVESEDHIEGLENGADLYVTKPFSSDVLKAQVKGILKTRRQLRMEFGKNPLSSTNQLVPNSKLDNEFLKKIEEIVMSRLTDDEFNIDTLAQEIGISRTGLFSKLRAVTEMTPNAFIKRIRLNEAARLLAEENLRVNEACYAVGFSSRSHFAKYFQEQFGVTPGEYKAASR